MGKVIFPDRESKLIEFKSQLPKFETLIKTCIAFANGTGGRIIIGVDDKTHEVVGIADEDRHKLYENFPNSLYDSVMPALVAQIYEQNFVSKSVLVIEIPMSPRKPYFLKSKGLNEGTYIRVGSATRKATPEYIEDLNREAQRLNYDEEIIVVNPNRVLSRELLTQFIGSRITKNRLIAERIIKQHSANKETIAPTIAGLLLFCETPHQYIHEALIKCTRFKGTLGRDILQTEDIVGTLEQQAHLSLILLNKWLTTHFEMQDVKLKRVIPLPQEALREAILNALLHRKYNIPGAVKIAIYDDRVEIFNPGCFPGLVDLNNLGDGTTYLRNPTLVRLAYKLNLIETRGTGIKLIYDSCQKAGLKKPEYHEEGDFVKIIFFFDPDPTAYKNEEASILALIKTRREVSAKEIAQYLSISHNTAIRKLAQLIKQKKIIKLGQGPAVRYRLK
ncbi:MAG: putative DNA binding domain-containing protein [Legionellales bacterium]|nr:putative DNA binding domain-containing protein [Legionellales bacterium]